MDKTELCLKLGEATYLVNAFLGEKPLDTQTSVGIGSGVAISSKGDLLTAAHVVTGRLPVRAEDVWDPALKILAKTARGKFIQYKPVLCGPGLDNEYMTEPLTVDLALLRPIRHLQEEVPYLKVSDAKVLVGSEVLMAGFPDDIELPFSFDQKLDITKPEVEELQEYMRIARHLLMIKSGMVGHRTTAVLSDGNRTVSGDVFYIDNELQTGASGGPVVNMDLEIVGIMTQRAITSVPFRETPDLRVPSGSTVAVSPRIIRREIEQLISETSDPTG